MAAIEFPLPRVLGIEIVVAAVRDGEYRSKSANETIAANLCVVQRYLTRDPKDGNLFRPGEHAIGMLDRARELGKLPETEAMSRVVVTGPYQLLPPLSDDDFKSLYDDIAKHGVKVPVEYDEAGEILDGHHRVAICKMLGITDWPRFVRVDLNEEGKRSFARSLNFARRQLSGAQKQAIIQEHLKDAPTSSNRAIAKDLGVDHKTVSAARKRLIDGGEIPHHDMIVGRDGIAQPVAKPIRTMFFPEVENLGEMKKVFKVIGDREHLKNVAQYMGVMAGSGAATPDIPALAAPRSNPRAAIGTSTRTNQERGFNLYETPDEAMFALLAHESFSARVKEPACGRGAISRRLEAAGYDVILSDLVDYGTADRYGVVQSVADFLTSEPDENVGCDIVTNPPYGTSLNAFVAHALRVHRPRKMALLLNLNFFCGFDDPDRCFAMEECPPARVLIFKRRLPMMHHDDYDGPEAASRMNTAFFIWEMDADGSYGQHGDTRTLRIDWKDYLPSEGGAE